MTSPLTAAGMELYFDSSRQVFDVRAPGGVPLARLRLLAGIDAMDATDEIHVTDVDLDQHGGDLEQISINAASSRWQSHRTLLRATPEALELTTTVEGTGRVATVRQLGARVAGRGLLPSDLLHRTVFSPNPDRPWRVLRHAEESAGLGVIGDGGQPGLGRWLFTPAPLCLGLSADELKGGEEAAGPWLMVGVAAAARPFTQFVYEALTPGFSLRYDYEGHTGVEGNFTTPTLLLFLADDPYQGLERYRDLLASRGVLPQRQAATPTAGWLQPMFCGWGAQNADAVVAADDGGALTGGERGAPLGRAKSTTTAT